MRAIINSTGEKISIARLRPKEYVAPSLKCPSCGTRYALVDDSLLMSPTQTVSAIRREGGLIGATVASAIPEFVVSESQNDGFAEKTRSQLYNYKFNY
jgi:hypothetical protein